MTTATNVVLVHGGFVDGSGWQAVYDPPDDGTLSLTAQQREIAMLAASGLTNKQIGERLYLSRRTVARHLYQLFPKLGVTSHHGSSGLRPDPDPVTPKFRQP
jgi:DNA-binding NarL/FixJ family response regulator